MRSSRSLGGVCAKLGAPANWAAPTATRARKPKLRVMAASIAVSAGQPSLAPHDITIVPRFGVLLQNPATIRISIQHPSLPRLEFKSGDFKPGLIAPSSLSTTRLAGQRAKAMRPSALPRAQAYADCRHRHRLNRACVAPA